MAFGEAQEHGERTEPPSPKRREDARRQGQIAKSPDLATAAMLLGALGAFALGGPRLVADAVEAVRRGIMAAAHPELSADGALALFLATCGTIARLAWPFVAAPAAAAIAVQLLQTRLVVSAAGLKPQWSRLNPARGLARMVSGQGLADTLKTVIRLSAVGAVAYLALRAAAPALLHLSRTDQMLGGVAAVIESVWLRVAVAILVLAALDYGHRWWAEERRLRMTREEVREERKESEGDPLLRGRLRSLHRQRAMRRTIAETRRADVVIRNPIHYAVALRYESAKMRAPRVVAKGARLMARRIVETAVRHGIPVVENPPLARSLYRLAAIGQEIPPELYRLVAEILARVYALRGRAR